MVLIRWLCLLDFLVVGRGKDPTTKGTKMMELTNERALAGVQMLIDGGEAVVRDTVRNPSIIGAVYASAAARMLGKYKHVDAEEFDELDLRYLLVRTNRDQNGDIEQITPYGVFTDPVYGHRLAHAAGWGLYDYNVVDVKRLAD